MSQEHPVDQPPAPNSATIPALRADYTEEQLASWRQRHARHVERAQAGQVDLLFLGDSITEGWLTTGREYWERDFAPLRAANFGSGGDRTQQVLWRIARGALEGIHPRAVVLLIGTNNLDPGLGGGPPLTLPNNPAEIVAGILAIVDVLRAKLPGTTVVLCSVLPRGGPGSGLRAAVEAINWGLRSLGGRAGVIWLDLTRWFLRPDGTLSEGYQPDGLHLNAAGYRAWAEALRPALAGLGFARGTA